MDYNNPQLTKDEKDSANSMKGAKVLVTILGILFFISLLIAIGGGNGIPSAVITLILMTIFQNTYNQSKKKYDLIQSYKLYYEKLNGKNRVFVDELATLVFQEIGVVQKNLEGMIKLGYISKVLSSGNHGRIVYIHETAIQTVADTEKTFVAVTCPACSGITQIPVGTVGVCDFCGSKIEG